MTDVAGPFPPMTVTSPTWLTTTSVPTGEEIWWTAVALCVPGIDYEYMLFPDEGHGFAKPENRLKFYAAAERFLARYLGGRFEE